MDINKEELLNTLISKFEYKKKKAFLEKTLKGYSDIINGLSLLSNLDISNIPIEQRHLLINQLEYTFKKNLFYLKDNEKEKISFFIKIKEKGLKTKKDICLFYYLQIV